LPDSLSVFIEHRICVFTIYNKLKGKGFPLLFSQWASFAQKWRFIIITFVQLWKR